MNRIVNHEWYFIPLLLHARWITMQNSIPSPLYFREIINWRHQYYKWREWNHLHDLDSFFCSHPFWLVGAHFSLHIRLPFLDSIISWRSLNLFRKTAPILQRSDCSMSADPRDQSKTDCIRNTNLQMYIKILLIPFSKRNTKGISLERWVE